MSLEAVSEQTSARRLFQLMVAFLLAFVIAACPANAFASDAGASEASDACAGDLLCGVDGTTSVGTDAGAGQAEAQAQATLLFFWAVGCLHCTEAKPFLDALEKSEPGLRVERIEVRQDAAGRRRFIETMSRLGVTAAGVPTFVVGDEYAVGYEAGTTEQDITAMVRRAQAAGAPRAPAPPAERRLDLPLIGSVDAESIPLPALTLLVGLVDGVNPCAMWVLIVLLGILLHVDTRRRMVLYAATFIVMSGVVYFVFMTAWSALFGLIGLSTVATRALGIALLAMGLVNMKEVFWFKKGVSLVIPDKAKPGLFRRMRGIAAAASLPAGLAGIAVLAFVVNLIELGCTLGLPAAYTRFLSLRQLSSGARYGYLALYNVAYVIPLFAIALTFIALRRRITMSEKIAKVLKLVSGIMLTAVGVLFLLVPDLLIGS